VRREIKSSLALVGKLGDEGDLFPYRKEGQKASFLAGRLYRKNYATGGLKKKGNAVLFMGAAWSKPASGGDRAEDRRCETVLLFP